MSVIIIILVFAFAFYVFIKNQNESSPPEIGGSLPGPGTYSFDIVGESNYQKALEKICGGKARDSAEFKTEAVLILENSNPHDNNAVRVDIENMTVGYLSRSNAKLYRKELARLGHANLTCKCKAMIVGGWSRSKSDQGNFGVKLDLPIS